MSDGLEHVIMLGECGDRMSAGILDEEIEIAGKAIREECEKLPSGGKNLLFAGLDDETAEYMEDVRLGRRKVQESSED